MTSSPLASARRSVLSSTPRASVGALAGAILLSGLLSGLLGGCTDDDGLPPPPPVYPVLLEALPESGLALEVTTDTSSPTPSFELKVDISYRRDSLGQGIPSGAEFRCPSLHASFTAALDGVSVEATDRGSWEPDGLTNGYYCNRPSLRIPVAAAQQRRDVTLSLGDDSLRYDLPLGDLLEPRQAALSGGAAWDFIDGRDVQVQWSHPTDLAPPGDVGDAILGFLGAAPNSGSILLEENGTTHADGKIDFTLPLQSQVHGEGTFAIGVKRAAYSCGTRCTVEATYWVGQVGVLRPR